jgi:transposase
MRYNLPDFEWSVIEPVLPKGRPGPRRKDDRRVMNGVFWVLRTGAPWPDLPERYGPYTTAYNRFNRWRKAGVWDRLMDAVSKAPARNRSFTTISTLFLTQEACWWTRTIELSIICTLVQATRDGNRTLSS